MGSKRELRLPALEIRQGPRRTLFSFAVDGKVLPRFAAISRIHRENGNGLRGYQRPEILSHIAEIRNYLESKDPMIPNSVVVAFDRSVRFEAVRGSEEQTEYARSGVLVVTYEEGVDEDMKPGWIVDGQQRVAAIREANVERFPINVVAFVAADAQEQREQFILVNSTKPLPKGLIYELLPVTSAKLPALLQRRRFPALLLDRLNHDPDSPLKGMISTPTSTQGLIKDNSVLRMLENSLSDGVLYRFRDGDSGTPNVASMLGVVKTFWAAAAEVFKGAWGIPPRRSRLMHGAGIVSLGFLMDAISDRHRSQSVPSQVQFQKDLLPLKAVCRWTDGYWDFGPGAQRKWNEIQNTAKDIQLLTNYLLIQYKGLVWNRKSQAGNGRRR